jgi:hypothetical protein
VVAVLAALSATDTARADDEAPARSGTLHFRNDAGSRFQLLEAHFVVDGQPVPTVLTSAERGRDYVVVSEPLSAGRHVVTADLLYRAKVRKVFTYVNGYRFNVRSDEVVTALPDHSATFTIVGVDKHGINTPVEKALTVKVETEVSTPGDLHSELP